MPASSRILILGGTSEARQTAAALTTRGYDVIVSLAGVTASPMATAGGVRRGGFGGAAGLAGYLRVQGIAAMIDATHPFAARMSENAAAAAAATGVALLRVGRPAWQPVAGDRWTEAASLAEAVAMLPAAARVFATVGRKDIGYVFARADLGGVARMIEAPDVEVPPGWLLVRARPPFEVAEEGRLMDRHGISHVVTKNSGGDDTYAKIVAARQRGIAVVMVARPRMATSPFVLSAADVVAEIVGRFPLDP